jgi:hypothetical protein
MSINEPVNLRDVRVIERREEASFTLETGKAVRIGCEVGWEDLERDVPLESRVARPIHFAHAASANGRRDLVLTDARSRVSGTTCGL